MRDHRDIIESDFVFILFKVTVQFVEVICFLLFLEITHILYSHKGQIN